MASKGAQPDVWLQWRDAAVRLQVQPPSPTWQLDEVRGAQPQQMAGPSPVDGNALLHSDNLTALHWLAASGWQGQFALGYIDPPFAMGRDLKWQRKVSGQALSGPAYSDRWAGGLPDYLSAWLPRLQAMLPLLRDDAMLVVHADWRATAALRVALDSLLGPECFRNEVIWRRAPNLGRQAASHQLGRVHDTLLVYARTPRGRFRGQLPRRHEPWPLTAAGTPKGARLDPATGRWFTLAPRGDYTDASIARLQADGRVHTSASGTHYIRYFLPQDPRGQWLLDKPLDSIWDDEAVRPLRHSAPSERLGYDTQKPEGLLQRLVEWATQPGDWVLDPCAGSGTTAAVAERLGRRWLTMDVGAAALHTVRRRLLDRDPPAQLTLWRDPATATPHNTAEALSVQLVADHSGRWRLLSTEALDGWSVDASPATASDPASARSPHRHDHIAFVGTHTRTLPLLLPVGLPAQARLRVYAASGQVAHLTLPGDAPTPPQS